MKDIVFILGPPGSGKSTICNKLIEEFQCFHISVGNLLREEIKANGKYSKLIEDIIKNGKIVPSDITINLLRKEIDSTDSKIILIDGFPRNEENYNYWGKIEKFYPIKFVIYLDCKKSIVFDRIIKRSLNSDRIDDNITSIKKRLNTFNKDTVPIINLYNNKGILKRIDSNLNIDDVYSKIVSLFKD